MTVRRLQGTGSAVEVAPGKWRLRIFLGTDEFTGNPRQRERVVRADGRREAERQLDELKKDFEKDTLKRGAVSVAQLLDEHMRSLKTHDRAARTIHADQRIVDSYLKPRFGSKQVSDLDVRDVEKWMMELHERSLAASSIRRIVAVMSSALSEAVRWRWVDVNVAQLARKPSFSPPEHSALTKDEVRRMISAADEDDEVNGQFMRLLVMTAARLGEVVALRWSDIDFESARVHIRRSLYRAGDQRGEGLPKGRRVGVVPLSPVAAAMLKDWKERAQLGGRITDESFVISRFPDGSRPINAETFSKYQGLLAKRLGITLGGRNPFRHAAATWIQDDGMAAATAAVILRHADRGVTLSSYTHPADEAQRRAVETFTDVLRTATP